MFKCLVLISVIACCKAGQYFQMSIDHRPDGLFKTITEPKPIEQKKVAESSGYMITAKTPTKKPKTADKTDRTGYAVPTNYEYVEKGGVDDTVYSAPYGYERSLYERQSYQRPTYTQQNYDQGYQQNMYVQKEYSSPISAVRNVEIRPIQTSGGYDQKDHMIDVKDETPIVIHFRTHANHIKVEQTRVPDKPREVEHTRSEDEPHRVVHEVYKPVIQEIREIIQPFRKVVQQVQPVVEEIQTVVHKSDGRRNRGGGGNGGGGGAGEGGSGQAEYGERVSYGRKRSIGGSNKKYNTLKDYLPQGSVHSIRGVPVYRSQYKGPAIPQKKVKN